MSWSITIQNLAYYSRDSLDADTAMMTYEHPEYKHDLILAYETAIRAGLKSATLTGMRTPNPYGGDEVVDISVRGMAKSGDFIKAMQEIIREPADDSLSVKHNRAEAYIEKQGYCSHDFTLIEDGDTSHMRCELCSVHLQHGLLHLQEDCS